MTLMGWVIALLIVSLGVNIGVTIAGAKAKIAFIEKLATLIQKRNWKMKLHNVYGKKKRFIRFRRIYSKEFEKSCKPKPPSSSFSVLLIRLSPAQGILL